MFDHAMEPGHLHLGGTWDPHNVDLVDQLEQKATNKYYNGEL